MTKEALKLALEALYNMVEDGDRTDKQQAMLAITSIEKTLAQPEQHQDWCASLTQMLTSMPPKPAPCNCKPPQRTWVGLTKDEVEILAYKAEGNTWKAVELAEAKLKEKNT